MILLVGASASGKTALSLILRKDFDLIKTVTYTTRRPRINEINGFDYNFVTEEVFKKMDEDRDFVETTNYNGNHYGSAKKDISDNKVLIVDPRGLKAYKSLQNPSIVSFYLNASEATRVARMKERLDSNENIVSRIKNDERVFTDSVKESCDFLIETDNRPLEAIAQDIYRKYKETIETRRITPISTVF